MAVAAFGLVKLNSLPLYEKEPQFIFESLFTFMYVNITVYEAETYQNNFSPQKSINIFNAGKLVYLLINKL